MTGTYLNQKVDDGAWPKNLTFFSHLFLAQGTGPHHIGEEAYVHWHTWPMFQQKPICNLLNILKVETPKSKSFFLFDSSFANWWGASSNSKWHLRSYGSRLKGCWWHVWFHSISIRPIILQGFIHLRWLFGISSINSIPFFPKNLPNLWQVPTLWEAIHVFGLRSTKLGSQVLDLTIFDSKKRFRSSLTPKKKRSNVGFLVDSILYLEMWRDCFQTSGSTDLRVFRYFCHQEWSFKIPPQTCDNEHCNRSFFTWCPKSTWRLQYFLMQSIIVLQSWVHHMDNMYPWTDPVIFWLRMIKICTHIHSQI